MVNFTRHLRSLTQANKRSKYLMRGWQNHTYASITDDPDSFALNQAVAIPSLESPSDVLIRVHAASVNPIDALVKEGCGATYFNIVRGLSKCSLPLRSGQEFPFILGRDCSGVVEAVGPSVRNFRAGDEVYCAVIPFQQGTLADYVVAQEPTISAKPGNVSHVEAASLPYVACTVWSALANSARYNAANAKGASVLVHGASGGIGSFAVQLLRAWGCQVTGTCRDDNAEFVKSLGAHATVDYSSADALKQLNEHCPFDLILDPVSTEFTRSTAQLLGIWRGCIYLTLVNSLLQDGDAYGVPFGLAKTALSFGSEFASEIASGGRIFAWGLFEPSGKVLSSVKTMVEAGVIKPVVGRVRPFTEGGDALAEVAKVHGRGKTVIDMMN